MEIACEQGLSPLTTPLIPSDNISAAVVTGENKRRTT